MGIMDDPFDQEEEERRFRLLGGRFLAEQEKVLSRPKIGQVKLAWDAVRKTLNKGGKAQNQVLDLILNEQIDEMLALSCRLLKLEIAKVCHIDKEADTNTFPTPVTIY